MTFHLNLQMPQPHQNPPPQPTTCTRPCECGAQLLATWHLGEPPSRYKQSILCPVHNGSYGLFSGVLKIEIKTEP
jgi:hypothetical protein